jgi:biopolymer transport protein TolQ
LREARSPTSSAPDSARSASTHLRPTVSIRSVSRPCIASLRKSASVQLGDLERSHGFLATTASATPFIGLFGTVWWIMNAFRGNRRRRRTASLASYAPGIAEALVATAAGLAAAIPAVIGYNHFSAGCAEWTSMDRGVRRQT